MRPAQLAVLVIALLGMTFSALGLSVTYLGVERLERPAVAFVQWQVEKQLREVFSPETLPEGAGGVFAAARDMVTSRIDIAEAALGSDLPDLIAERIARLCVCSLPPEERENLAERFEVAKANAKAFVEAAMRGSIERDRVGLSTLEDLIAGHYVATVDGLIRDLRIFFGSNLALFAIIGIAGVLSSVAPALVVPAGLLAASTVAAAAIYLFEQNWFYTIIFGSYVGWGYLIWVAIIALFLIDITLNRARVTSAILESLHIEFQVAC